MNAKTIELLLIEDNPNDVELVVAELERSGYDLRFEHVDSVERLRNALAEGGWEIVLSDYNVPGFDFHSALAVTIEHGHGRAVHRCVGDDPRGSDRRRRQGRGARLRPQVEPHPPRLRRSPRVGGGGVAPGPSRAPRRHCAGARSAFGC